MNETNNELLYTLPLKRFCKYTIREYDSVPIEEIDAVTIQAIDQHQDICHVQFNDFDGDKLHTPRLWLPSNWRKSYTHHVELKKQSAIDRRKANIFTENRDRVTKKLIAISGLDEKTAKEIATKMILKSGAEDRTRAFLGIKLDKFSEEE